MEKSELIQLIKSNKSKTSCIKALYKNKGPYATKKFNSLIQKHGIVLSDYYKMNNHCLCCDKITKNPKFCCQSCSASFNNSNRNTKNKKCLNCSCKIPSNRTYCSLKCNSNHKLIKNLSSGEASFRTIKRYLIEVHGHYCRICNNEKWNDKPIPLELEHIDGNSENNKLYNLIVICPNCHAQTSTYKGKNIGNGRKYRRNKANLPDKL